MNIFQVRVGELWVVYDGDSYMAAAKTYDFHVMNSRGFVADPGGLHKRGVGQPVRLIEHGKTIEEYAPEEAAE
jgi:hypothetical protein